LPPAKDSSIFHRTPATRSTGEGIRSTAARPIHQIRQAADDSTVPEVADIVTRQLVPLVVSRSDVCSVSGSAAPGDGIWTAIAS
jgi:hypothetical protein